MELEFYLIKALKELGEHEGAIDEVCSILKQKESIEYDDLIPLFDIFSSSLMVQQNVVLMLAQFHTKKPPKLREVIAHKLLKTSS